MVTIKDKCCECDTDVMVTIGQMESPEELAWYANYTCSQCGFTIESDDTGFPPDNIRKAILKEQGEWCIRVDDLHSKIVIAKTLRQYFEVSLKESALFIKKIPGYMMKGTQVEMQWIQSLLQSEGIQSDVQKLDGKAEMETELLDIAELKVKE